MIGRYHGLRYQRTDDRLTTANLGHPAPSTWPLPSMLPPSDGWFGAIEPIMYPRRPVKHPDQSGSAAVGFSREPMWLDARSQVPEPLFCLCHRRPAAYFTVFARQIPGQQFRILAARLDPLTHPFSVMHQAIRIYHAHLMSDGMSCFGHRLVISVGRLDSQPDSRHPLPLCFLSPVVP